jgi:hypothetical protein
MIEILLLVLEFFYEHFFRSWPLLLYLLGKDLIHLLEIIISNNRISMGRCRIWDGG